MIKILKWVWKKYGERIKHIRWKVIKYKERWNMKIYGGKKKKDGERIKHIKWKIIKY